MAIVVSGESFGAQGAADIGLIMVIAFWWPRMKPLVGVQSSNRLNVHNGSFCSCSPENHCTGREEDEESHGRVRDEVGRAVVPDAHHRSRLALVQELHEGVTNLYVERLDEFFNLT